MAITPNTPNPVREDAYVEELSEKLGIDPQYIPKSPVWRNEEEIKAIAEMFANMQGGGSSGGGVLVVGITAENSSYIANKTAAEIFAAMKTGAVVFSDTNSDEVYVCTHAYIDSNAYYFKVDSFNFSAETGADYPTASL